MGNLFFGSSIVIDAPVDAVYSYISDFSKHVDWNHQLEKMVSITEGPPTVGSQYRTYEGMARNVTFSGNISFKVMGLIGKVLFGSADYTEAEITAMEENQRVAWKARLPSKKGDLMRYNWELRLEPDGHSTRVIQHGEPNPPSESPLGKLYAKEDFRERTLRDAKEEALINLHHLKRILEGQGS